MPPLTWGPVTPGLGRSRWEAAGARCDRAGAVHAPGGEDLRRGSQQPCEPEAEGNVPVSLSGLLSSPRALNHKDARGSARPAARPRARRPQGLFSCVSRPHHLLEGVGPCDAGTGCRAHCTESRPRHATALC